MTSNWEFKRLGDLGTWYGGGTPSKSRPDYWDGGSIPWLSPKDMTQEVLAGSQDHITSTAIAQSSTKLLPAGSVTIVVRSGILERKIPVAIVPFQTTLNQDMKAVIPRAGIDARWIAWGIRSAERQILSSCRKAGTTVASLNVPALYDFRLPVPPLAEQRRIVEILEEHLSHLDAAESYLNNGIRRLAILKQASLMESISSASGGAETTYAKIGSIAKVGSGATPLKSKRIYYDGGAIPWVTSGDLATGQVDDASHFITTTALAETAVKLYEPGTLLVAMYGEGKTRGTVAELKIRATTNQACAAICLIPEFDAYRPWLKLFLEANYEAMRRQASGGVQPNLSLAHIKSMLVPLPPTETVSRLLQIADHWRSACAQARREVEIGRARSAGLRRSLLTAALSGRLTGESADRYIVEELASVG